MKRKNGFTLVELLVVISIIALLISLLLPALAKARQLAVRIEGAANMQQIGIALHEYASEYRGQYPLANTAVPNFADANDGTAYNQFYAPLAGLSALYVSSYGYIANQPLINPQAGVLPDTAAGLSLLFCPDTNSGFTQAYMMNPGYGYYNSQGSAIMFGVLTGLSYWVDFGEDYSPSYDLYAITTGTVPWYMSAMRNQSSGFPAGRPNFDPLHQPALNPQSNGSTLLVTDNVLFADQTGTQGLTNWVYPIGADSNYVDEGLGSALPAGEHEMYNDGSVAWVPMSKIKVRFIWADTFYYGW